jgi:hypothetical protein
MSTDKNKCDDFLKEKLYRDLIFRGVIWGCISILAGYFAITSLGLDPLNYFDRVGKSIGPLVNTLGAFSLLICAPALMLKDLEATLKDPVKISATRGYLGGALRRIAGDLSLWTLGALITMITTLAFTITQIEMKASEYAAIASLGAVLLIMTLLVGAANIYVRRAGHSPMLLLFSNPMHIATAYSFAIIVLAGGLLKSAA